MLTKYITFLKAHEMLLFVAGFLFVILTLGSKYLDHAAAKADVKVAATQQVVAQDASQNKTLATQLAGQRAEYLSLAQTTEAQIASLQAAILARDTAMTQRQAVDQTATPVELAGRWQNLLQLTPSDIVPGFGGQETVSEAGSKATVSALEQVPELTKDKVDLETEVTAQKGQLDDAMKVGLTYGAQVTGLQGQLTDADKACQAEIAQVKAQARKGKLRWFAAGYVLGVISKRLILGRW